MALKELKAKLVGITPCLQHNGRLANPMHLTTQEIAKISRRRNKTEADFKLLSSLEWIGGAYTTEPGDIEIQDGILKIEGFGSFCWPGENIKSMLRDAARVRRLGRSVEQGLFCDGNWPIVNPETGKPISVVKAFQDPLFWDLRKVVVQNRSLIRTRPIIPQWTLDVAVTFEDDILEEGQVQDIFHLAGQRIGLSDYRPSFGRFECLF